MEWTLVIFGLGCTALVARRYFGSWLAPAPILAGYWVAATALPLIVTRFRFIWEAGAVVLLDVAVFTIGAYLAGRPRVTARPMETPPEHRYFRWAAIAGGLCAVAAGLYTMHVNHVGLHSLTSVSRLLVAGNEIDLSISGSGGGTPLAVTALLTITYLGAFVAPLATSKRGHRLRYVLAPTVGALLYAVISTRRETFLLTAALTCASAITAATLRRGRPPRIRGVHLLAALLAGTVLAGAFVGIAYVRVGRTGSDVNQAIGAKLDVYAFGYLAAFSDWIQPAPNEIEPPKGHLTYGSQTFAGVLGAHGVSKGYTDSRIISPDASATNIFTSFRPLLQDFGLAGDVLVMFLAGFLVQRSWIKLIAAQKVSSMGVLGAFYTWTLTSATQSPFIFLNVTLAIVAGGVAFAYRPLLYGQRSASADISVVLGQPRSIRTEFLPESEVRAVVPRRPTPGAEGKCGGG